MSALFASGRIVDAILALTAIEGLVVLVYRRRTGRGPPSAAFACDLLSGMSLLMTVRLALGGAWWGWLATCLLGSLVGHLAALRLSWSR